MKLLTKTPPKTASISPEFTVPDNWDALTIRQLFGLVRLFRFGLLETAYKLAALNMLSGIKVTGKSHFDKENDRWLFEIKHNKQKHWLTAGLYCQMLKTVNYLTQPPTLTNQLLPKFRFLFARFYGPDDACYNISYNELIHAQLAFSNYANTKKVEYLDQLVAVLYRPRKRSVNKMSPTFDGDVRQQFSAYNYQRRAWWFKLLPFRLKYAVYIFYSGSLALMQKEHPLCFKPSTRISSTPKQHNPAKELIDLVPVITKADPTKNKKVYASPAWDVFDAYESALREYQAMKGKK